MAEGLTAGPSRVVTLHYTLTNPAGDVLDTSRDDNGGGEPFAYLHGFHNIVSGLEKGLEGLGVGDKRIIVVPPEMGYGKRESPGAQLVPREAFGDADVFEGLAFQAETDAGTLDFFVTGIGDDGIMVDTDHPLAGVTLHFDVEILRVRSATRSELDHGHPHGEGGHAH